MNSYFGDLEGGNTGRKTSVDNFSEIACSIAQESMPLQPPDIMTGFDDLTDFINEITDSLSVLRLDPMTPNLIGDSINGNKIIVNRLRHHSRSFLGCFSITTKEKIDIDKLKQWKVEVNHEMTLQIANVIIPYIQQFYDFITTAPPSLHRNWNHYCCFELCQNISEQTKIPFIISFKQRTKKSAHGRFESIRSELPKLLDNFHYMNKSILFIDDVITSGTTAKTCYEQLRNLKNHVDGLIYCEWK